MDLNKKLSKHFKLKEMLRSQTATRLNIKNIPEDGNIDKLELLCKNILEPIRAYCRYSINKGAIVQITSGYRCPELNKSIGGAKESQHMLGEAADFVITGVDEHELWRWITLYSGLDYDKIVMEFPDSELNIPWIHISYRRDELNRNINLIALKDFNNKTIYKSYSENKIKNMDYVKDIKESYHD